MSNQNALPIDKSLLPKSLKEFYQQYAAKNPESALNLSGFAAVGKGEPWTIQVEQQWTDFLANGKEYMRIEPWHGMKVHGHSLLSAIEADQTGLVDRLLEMGFDPKAVYQKEGTNALHFAAWCGNLPLMKRLTTEFKMSFCDPDGNGKPGLHYLGARSGAIVIPLPIQDWLYSLPNYREIMNANPGTHIQTFMIEYENRMKAKEQPKEGNDGKDEKTGSKLECLKASILASKCSQCATLKFFEHLMLILEGSLDEKKMLESISHAIQHEQTIKVKQDALAQKLIQDWLLLTEKIRYNH